MKISLRQEVTIWDKLAEYFGFQEIGSTKVFYEGDVHFNAEVTSW